MKNLLADAQKRNYAVGSFSVANMEMVLGVIKAAEETQSPIILQIAEVRLNHSPLALIIRGFWFSPQLRVAHIHPSSTTHTF